MRWDGICSSWYRPTQEDNMAKNNIRSVRFSDEMIEIINQQVGENFTQKFERLVYNCYMDGVVKPSRKWRRSQKKLRK